MVELKAITRDNIEQVLSLSVFDYQQCFVSSPAHSLAQAWVYRDTAFPFAVYADDILVGFVMLGYYEQKNQYTLWKFMIDKRYQNKGYGRQALGLALRYLIDNFHADEIYTGVAFGNDAAKRLYHSVGFRETGEADDFQLEMKLTVKI